MHLVVVVNIVVVFPAFLVCSLVLLLFDVSVDLVFVGGFSPLFCCMCAEVLLFQRRAFWVLGFRRLCFFLELAIND